MDIILESLNLKCKQEMISIPFSKSITYFYGKMGAGKSTIARLISFCFGYDLIETPALQKELLSVILKMKIGDYFASLSRSKNENIVRVEWVGLDEQSPNCVFASIDPKEESIIPGEQVFCLSDLLFYLSGHNPPRVKRSKTSENSELIRLSFKNVMLFWYLDQDHIDNSFFNLDKDAVQFKKNPSLDVMRMVLGYYYENIAQLEMELSQIRSKKLVLKDSIEQVQSLLKENNIPDVATIAENIEKVKTNQHEKEEEREEAIKGIYRSNQHVVDEIREKLRSLCLQINELEYAQREINMQIEKRQRLLNEFRVSAIKLQNLKEAKEILKDADFESCPKCNLSLSHRKHNHDVCSLCQQPIESDKPEQYDIIKLDLDSRCKEIEYSINKMEKQHDGIKKQLQNLVEEKMKLDTELVRVEHDYDSIYLARIRHLDKIIEQMQAEIDYLEKINKLSMSIPRLQSQIDAINIEEDNLEIDYKEALEKLKNENNKLEDLKQVFKECLVDVRLPGIQTTDLVMMDTKEFYPRVFSKDDDIYEITFRNLGSGGKKTIFKSCFAFAIQRLLKDTDVPFPHLLIIDTPMKNISERENIDVYEGFYQFVYKVMATELKNMQLIIIDKEFYNPPKEYAELIEVDSRHMTPDDKKHPGLITYYEGH